MTGLDLLAVAAVTGVGTWLAVRHPRAAVLYVAVLGVGVAGLVATSAYLVASAGW